MRESNDSRQIYSSSGKHIEMKRHKLLALSSLPLRGLDQGTIGNLGQRLDPLLSLWVFFLNLKQAVDQ